jgi:hypothetical protein
MDEKKSVKYYLISYRDIEYKRLYQISEEKKQGINIHREIISGFKVERYAIFHEFNIEYEDGFIGRLEKNLEFALAYKGLPELISIHENEFKTNQNLKKIVTHFEVNEENLKKIGAIK